MSLEHVAAHLAAQGRGPDETLVHMSGKELAGLQTLANMHGGSLTSNPATGLPEAGFLDDLMPTLVGAAGMYFGLDPMTTAAIMGGGTAVSTGDLGKGLMAGLGAYGGGNLMQGALAGGSTNIGAAALDQATQDATYSGLTGDAYNQAVQQGVSDSMANLTNADKFAAYTPSTQGIGSWGNIGMAAAPAIMGAMQPNAQAPQTSQQMIRPYTFAANPQTPANMVGTSYQPGQDTSERLWFQPQYTALTPYKAAEGGIVGLAGGGPVEQMSNANSIGQNTGYPQADIQGHAYATPWQTPVSENMVTGAADTGVNRLTGEMTFAAGGLSSLADMVTGEEVMPIERRSRAMAAGGISSLGGYSDGGRLLKGPGDGMSDNIPAQIGEKQPARLADGEFVVPADVVSHLGNGSTDAGAKQLYKMMNKVRQARTGNPKQGKQINPGKFVPA